MGISPHPLLVSLNFKGMVLENEEMSRARRILKMKRKIVKSRRTRSVLMKSRTCLEGSKRPESAIEERVRTLKSLIPNSEGMGLDGLFRETADYILSLQMRARVMQIMVKVLTGSDE